MRLGTPRLTNIILGASLLVGLLVSRPNPLQAADTPSPRSDPWSAEDSPAERALTGGVSRLRAPASKMILIRKSQFVMGSTPTEAVEAVSLCLGQPLPHRCSPDDFTDELPAHPVKLSAYWLDRTEVTVAQYRRCVALRRCKPAPFARGARRFDRPRYPMTFVRHEDAKAFCAFRRARLPTEAEFERAVRGRTGRTYPWGKIYNSRVSNHGRLGVVRTDGTDGYRELAPVGSYPSGRTPDGFLDLAGNVMEWVSDRFGPYPDKLVVDPTGPARGVGPTARVLRGGSYINGPTKLRAAARDKRAPSVRAPFIGFRCARSHGPRRTDR